jgi:signal transduction histidine kinase
MAEVKKVHIIDDDPSSIQVLEYVLVKKGFSVKSSTAGAQALEQLQQYTPDLILLDIIMPQMDGYEVCAALKQDERLNKVPVIFITASNNPVELVRGFEAGAVDFISKPLNKSELLARVNTHIELMKSRELLEKRNAALKNEIRSRKQTEEKFKALSETSFEAVLFLQDITIIEYNKAAAELFGLQSNVAASILSFTDAKGTALLRKILASGEGQGQWEITFFNANKKPFFGRVQSQTFHYKGKNVVVLAISDITRQKEIDNEIFSAIINAEENQRKRFSRDMHDGLGALLSALKIYINLYQKPSKTTHEKEMLLNEINDTLAKAVESARTIANNLMPSVLMDHGLMKALKSFTDSLHHTGAISIEFLFPPQTIKIDPVVETHVYRICLELINNTLKYAQASEINLEIDFRDDNLFLKYRDNGCGFDFEQIYRVKSGNQGLRNILSRVNALHGEGQFYTGPGKGMLFVMEIPL